MRERAPGRPGLSRLVLDLPSDRPIGVVRGSPSLRDSARRARSDSSICRGLPSLSPAGLSVPERGRPRSGRRHQVSNISSVDVTASRRHGVSCDIARPVSRVGHPAQMPSAELSHRVGKVVGPPALGPVQFRVAERGIPPWSQVSVDPLNSSDSSSSPGPESSRRCPALSSAHSCFGSEAPLL